MGKICVLSRVATSVRATVCRRPSPVPRCLRLAASALPHPSSSSRPLHTWVRSNGGQVADAVQITSFGDGGGYGLSAGQSVSAGDRLIMLNRRCMLTYDETCDPRLLAVIDQVPAELWGAKLALQLLNHRLMAASSPYAAYIAQLPVGVAGVPIFFSREAINALEYPPVTEQVKKRCRWLYDFSTKVLAGLAGAPGDPFGGAHVDINALGWALACVTSRAFRVRGPSHPAALLPLIDMCNHSFQPNCEVLPVEGGGCSLVAKHSIAAGDALLISYGPLPNDFLLMDYGFLQPDNPHDRVQLRFDLDLIQVGVELARVYGPDQKPLELQPSRWQSRVLAQLGLQGPGANLEVTLGGSQLVDPRLVAATRVLLARSEAELQGRNMMELGTLALPLSRAAEVATLRTLAGVAAMPLSRFSTPLQQDQLMLGLNQGKPGGDQSASASEPPPGQSVPSLADDLRMAIAFRAEKKKLLSAVIQGLGARLQQVQEDKSLTKPAPRAPATGTSGKGFGKQK
ncbi:hypothetical protein V8C86DRAFT_2940393 [Haematococcus lacustris]